MNKLYILCGIPGSGKSTWIKNRGVEHLTISRDKVRFLMLNDGDEYFSKEKEVFETFIYEICTKMSNVSVFDTGEVYVDATHLNAASRAKLINAIKKEFNYELKDWDFIPIVFNVPFEVAAARNELREGRAKVPMSSMRRMACSFKAPSAEEGFKEYYIINEKGETVSHRYLR